jgi:hypothetical protein
MVKTVSVADYIVERLATEGINHCFGVAGRSALFCTKDVLAAGVSVRPSSDISPKGGRIGIKTILRP